MEGGGGGGKRTQTNALRLSFARSVFGRVLSRACAPRNTLACPSQGQDVRTPKLAGHTRLWQNHNAGLSFFLGGGAAAKVSTVEGEL